MFDIADTPTLFIPGCPSLTPAEQILHNQKVEGGRFFHRGLATNYYVSRAVGRERMIIIGFSGANAQFPLDYEEIKRLNNAGATMICMALPRVGPDFMQRSETLVRAFLKDKASPANTLVLSDAPQFIIPHSSSCPITVKLFGENDTGRMLRSRFTGVGLLSPLWDVPKASRDHSPAIGPFNIGPVSVPAIRPLSRLFEAYADRNADKAFNDLLAVKLYLRLFSKESYTDKKTIRGMTMGHIRQIQNYARDVIDNYKPEHTSGVDMLLMTGDADPCTCHKTSKDVSDKIGAKFRLVAGGGHDLIKQDPSLLNVFLEEAEKHISRHERQKAAAMVPAELPFPFRQDETIPLPRQPLAMQLRNGARFALERGAGALNATTSFF